jgi:hypothetical protein
LTPMISFASDPVKCRMQVDERCRINPPTYLAYLNRVKARMMYLERWARGDQQMGRPTQRGLSDPEIKILRRLRGGGIQGVRLVDLAEGDQRRGAVVRGAEVYSVARVLEERHFVQIAYRINERDEWSNLEQRLYLSDRGRALLADLETEAERREAARAASFEAAAEAESIE